VRWRDKKAAAYGKCVIEDYNDVHRDKCAKAFMALKDCVLAASVSTFIIWDGLGLGLLRLELRFRFGLQFGLVAGYLGEIANTGVEEEVGRLENGGNGKVYL
jgi:hypothetical protein